MEEVILEVSKWGGAISGALGAFGVSCQTKHARWWGFIGFTMSNIFLVILFSFTKAWPLLATQVIYLFFSIRGLKNNK
jgi:hypothetical protein